MARDNRTPPHPSDALDAATRYLRHVEAVSAILRIDAELFRDRSKLPSWTRDPSLAIADRLRRTYEIETLYVFAGVTHEFRQRFDRAAEKVKGCEKDFAAVEELTPTVAVAMEACKI